MFDAMGWRHDASLWFRVGAGSISSHELAANHACGRWLGDPGLPDPGYACRKSNPNISVMLSAQDQTPKNMPGCTNTA
jgi:hypothetical protein